MEQIGARLREARMRGKIDINQVEADTKIRAKYLRAMENEEWELLPGEIYAKTFLRSYADYLGLDSRELVDDYRRLHERPTDHDLRPLSSGRERERRPSNRRRQQPQPHGGGGFRIPPWTIVVLVLVGVGVALYIVGSHTGNNNNPPSQNASSQHKHHTRKRHHKHTTPTKHHKTVPKSVTLKLVPTGTVYVCLVNANGHQLIPGTTFSAGQTVPPQVAKTLLMTLGNNSVTVTANGAKVPIAPSGGPIGIKFTPHGHSPLPSSSQPQCS
jgi:cytoskeleton protein RodZ